MSIITDIEKLAREVRDTAKRVEEKQDRLEEKSKEILTQLRLLHSRFGFNESRMLALSADIKLIIQKLEGGGGNNPPPFDPNYITGNFLATPNFPFSFMYPAWDANRRAEFRKEYKKYGNFLPISIWASYGGFSYNYYNDVKGFRDIVFELKGDGIEPILFVITDAVDQDTQILPKDAAKFCNFWLPKVNDLFKHVCLGWELNQVKGWDEHEDKESGAHMIALSKLLRWHFPLATIWLHLQPNWWAPHYESKNEWDWWRDADEVNGLLAQIRPDSSISLEGDPTRPDGLYIMLKYPGPNGTEGIAGRLRSLNKQFVMLEHSRELSRYEKVRNIIIADKRVSGYC